MGGRDAAEASAWLEKIARDGKARSAAASDAVELLNRALGALRDAADDPLVHDVGVTGALSIRIGYGSGDQLADGAWTEARQLPDPPPPRHLELDPQQQVADELAGRRKEETATSRAPQRFLLFRRIRISVPLISPVTLPLG